VAFNATAAIECIGNDDNLEMSTTISGTCMTGMQVALVFDEQVVGRKYFGQQRFNFGATLGTHGNTGLNGLTVTLR
jgi:hypothetical protein